MATDLGEFLARYAPAAEEELAWSRGQLRLRVACYLSEDLPPLDYVTSVRSLVFQGRQVLVVRNEAEAHIWPGGRREEGEALEQTLRREVLEETGWEVAPISRLGFVRYRHLTPRPPEYRYPYPEFMQVIYASTAIASRPEARISDDYEIESAFRPINQARALGITLCQKVLLDSARYLLL